MNEAETRLAHMEPPFFFTIPSGRRSARASHLVQNQDHASSFFVSHVLTMMIVSVVDLESLFS